MDTLSRSTKVRSVTELKGTPMMFTSFTLFPTPTPCIEFVTTEGDLKFIEPHLYLHRHLPSSPLRVQFKQLNSKVTLLYLVKNHRPVAPPLVLKAPIDKRQVISKLEELASKYEHLYSLDPSEIRNLGDKHVS